MAPAETSTYRILRGRHSRNEGGNRKLYIAGDEIELTDAAAKRMGSAIEPLRTASGKRSTETAAKTDSVAGARTAAPVDGQTAAADADTTASADFDFSFVNDMNVDAVEEHVAGVDDVDELKAMKRHEKKNKDRVTVMKAIDARLAELK